jgi:hypothetical protein
MTRWYRTLGSALFGDPAEPGGDAVAMKTDSKSVDLFFVQSAEVPPRDGRSNPPIMEVITSPDGHRGHLLNRAVFDTALRAAAAKNTNR